MHFIQTILLILGGLLLWLLNIALFALIIGFPLMWVWNWIMPLFGITIVLNFWKALGLYILICILTRPFATK